MADPVDPGPPLIFDETEARRAEKNFLENVPPPVPLTQGLDDRPLPPPLYLKVWIRHYWIYIISHSSQETVTVVSDCILHCWSIIGVRLVSCKIKPVLRSGYLNHSIIIPLQNILQCSSMKRWTTHGYYEEGLFGRSWLRVFSQTVHLLPSPWVCVSTAVLSPKDPRGGGVVANRLIHPFYRPDFRSHQGS